MDDEPTGLGRETAFEIRRQLKILANRSLSPDGGLPGSLHAEWKRCGCPRCRCATGQLHGPYWARRWREGDRLRRAYVPREQVAEVQAAIDLRRRLRPVPWVARQALAELRAHDEQR